MCHETSDTRTQRQYVKVWPKLRPYFDVSETNFLYQPKMLTELGVALKNKQTAVNKAIKAITTRWSREKKAYSEYTPSKALTGEGAVNGNDLSFKEKSKIEDEFIKEIDGLI